MFKTNIRKSETFRPTGIEWVKNPDGTKGYVWDVMIGCKHPCQEYCWAKALNERNRWIKKWNDPQYLPQERFFRDVEEMKKLEKPSTIAVGMLTDLFGNWVNSNYIQCVIDVTEQLGEHTFLFLTKNGKRCREFSFPSNCMLGVTITGKNELPPPAFTLLGVPCFISFEPVLAPLAGIITSYLPDWVIIGSLNKDQKPIPPEKRGTKKEWVEPIIEEASKLKIPIFIKRELKELYPDLPNKKEIFRIKHVVNG
jgi:hypothetical protein